MTTDEDKRKHLEFLQAVIGRMATTSFLLKAWSVTLVAALFALAAKDAKTGYLLVAFIPLCLFWVLDGYYLMQERAFRHLYDIVRNLTATDVDYGMKPTAADSSIGSWSCAFFSVTIAGFYGPLIGLTIITAFIVR
jgi:hypothetical protein